MKISRINRASLFIAIGCIFLCHPIYSQKKEALNIIFIMSDDHCDRSIGAYGGRLSSLNPTPNLDKLASEGMLFNNVFCTNSICTPSRATILTGQYSHVNGVYDLYDGLPGEQHYLLKEMQQSGYTTAVVGKWHLRNSPQNADYFAVIAGQGKYINPVMHVSQGGEKRNVRFDSTLSKEINVVDTEGHSSDVLTDITLDWLENKRDTSKPFFLMHHFKAPHDMFVYADRYKDYLENTEIPEPENLYDQPGEHFGSVATRGVDDELVSTIGSSISPRMQKRNLSKYYKNKIKELTGKEVLTDKELTHHSYQMYVKEYLRCVKGIDDNLKRIFDYLRSTDMMDNTIIMYTSDQGMLLGEHDFIDKRWMYDESIRMPLIVYHPKMIEVNRRSDWLINNADYAPTLLELAGIDTPNYMQGHSFVEALKGKDEPESWRKATYYRYWMHMAHGHNNPAHFGIRTKKHKLIFFYGSDYTNMHGGKERTKFNGNRYWENTPVAWEFYDLENDPAEMNNRYNDPEYQDEISKLKELLKSKRFELKDTDENYPQIKNRINEYWGD